MLNEKKEEVLEIIEEKKVTPKKETDEKEKKEKLWKKDHIFVLIISNNRYNYLSLFADTKINGIPLKCDQAFWDEIRLSCYEKTSTNNYGLVIEIDEKKKEIPFKNSMQHKRRTVKPDIVLIRNVCRSNYPYDHRNILFGLMYSGIPCVNSAYSIYCDLERVIVHSELMKIQEKLGKENFPLIDQYYHSSGMDINFTFQFPICAKIGPVHAGFGKTLVKDSDRLRDLRSVVSLHNDYCTTEPFIESDYELRLQKIGNHYRAMKKQLLSYWKSNVRGTCVIEDVKLEKNHKLWLDECSKLFGGMDIFALDVLHGVDGKFYILELNGTSIGFGPDHEVEDLLCIKEVVVNNIKKQVLKMEKKDTVEKTVNEHEVENTNLKNEVMEKDVQIKRLQKDNERLKAILKNLQEKKQKKSFSFFGW